MKSKFNGIFYRGFDEEEEALIQNSIIDINQRISFSENGKKKFEELFILTFVRSKTENDKRVSARTIIKKQEIYIILYDGCFNGSYNLFKNLELYAKGTIVHELAHALDIVEKFKLSDLFLLKTESEYKKINEKNCYFPKGYGIYKGTTKNGHMNHYDDFAESFATFIYGPTYDKQGFFVDTKRLSIIYEMLGGDVK